MLTAQLTTIASIPTTNDAINQLDIIYANPDNTSELIKAAFKEVPKPLQARLGEIFLDRQALGDFRVGDQVVIQSKSIDLLKIKRGRVRVGVAKRGKLWRRIGSAKQVIGVGKCRGNHKIRYAVGVAGESSICLYPSLVGVELVIDSVYSPYLACVHPSGTFAPGLLKTDLIKCKVDS
jgi:hypothetical protein